MNRLSIKRLSIKSIVAPRALRLGAGALALAALSACIAPVPVYQSPVQQSRYPYQPAQPAAYPGQGAYAQYGRVANIEVLRTEGGPGGTSGVGAVGGGVIGGVVGNQFGHGSGRAAATAIGAVGGALLGNAIESNRNGRQVVETYRVSIQTEDGGYRAFDVPNPGDLRVGDRVRIDNGQISRM